MWKLIQLLWLLGVVLLWLFECEKIGGLFQLLLWICISLYLFFIYVLLLFGVLLQWLCQQLVIYLQMLLCMLQMLKVLGGKLFIGEVKLQLLLVLQVLVCLVMLYFLFLLNGNGKGLVLLVWVLYLCLVLLSMWQCLLVFFDSQVVQFFMLLQLMYIVGW